MTKRLIMRSLDFLMPDNYCQVTTQTIVKFLFGCFLCLVSDQLIYAQSVCGFDETNRFYVHDRNHSNDYAQRACADPKIKYIRVAYHFIQRNTGTGNFTATDDGLGNTNYNGYQRADDIIKFANEKLASNHDAWLKTSGETYPTPPPTIPIRYVLTGVYFHQNSSYYNASYNILTSIHNDLGVDVANTINIYDRTFPEYVGGSAILGFTGVNVSTYPEYVYDVQDEDGDLSNLGRKKAGWIVNHEIGHVLKLLHAWKPDDCDDTVDNPNCYAHHDTLPPPCNNWAFISNNVMDYSVYNRLVPSLTCDQIEIMERELVNTNYAYAYNVDFNQTNCEVFCDDVDTQPAYSFFVSSVDYWTSGNVKSVEMEASVSFMEEEYQIQICRTGDFNSTSTDCQISTLYNSGWITGEAGKIRLSDFYSFVKNNSYLVTLTVNNSSCGRPHSSSQLIRLGKNPIIIDVSGPLNSSNRTIVYELPEQGPVKIIVVDADTGNPVKTIVNNEYRTTGQHTENISIIDLEPGLYKVILYSKENMAHGSFIKM